MKRFFELSLKVFGSNCTTFLLLALMAAPPQLMAQEKPAATVNRDPVIAAAREIIGLQKYCALVTIDSTGQPQVRTMNPFPPENDMTVWIATNSRSRKIREIKNNPRVCLYYADHNQAFGYVTIVGKAVLVDDMKEKLKRKKEYWDQAFPDWKYLNPKLSDCFLGHREERSDEAISATRA